MLCSLGYRFRDQGREVSIERDGFFGLLRWLRRLWQFTLRGRSPATPDSVRQGRTPSTPFHPAHVVLALGALVAVAYAGSRLLRLTRAQRRAEKVAPPPDLAEAPTADSPAEPEAEQPVSDGPGVDEHGFVILNQATAAELQQLPGVGARRAQAIVRLRRQLGRFDDIRQLSQVRGISASLLEAFEPMVVLDGAPRSVGPHG